MNTLITKISEWSMGAYLVSWIFDQIFYPILKQEQPIMQLRLEYFFVIVPTIYICSLLLSAALNLIAPYITKGILSCLDKHIIKQKVSIQ